MNIKVPLNRTPKDSMLFLVLFACFLTLLLALDLYIARERGSAPEALANVVCSIRPNLSLANIAFSKTLINYATAQCQQGNVAEPVFSIVFLMLKLHLLVLAVIAYWICALLWPQRLLEGRQSAFDALRERNGVASHIKTTVGIAFFLLVGGAALLWKVSMTTSPLNYPVGKYYFKDVENFAVMWMWLCAVLATTNIYYLATFIASSRSSRRSK